MMHGRPAGVTSRVSAVLRGKKVKTSVSWWCRTSMHVLPRHRLRKPSCPWHATHSRTIGVCLKPCVGALSGSSGAFLGMPLPYILRCGCSKPIVGKNGATPEVRPIQECAFLQAKGCSQQVSSELCPSSFFLEESATHSRNRDDFILVASAFNAIHHQVTLYWETSSRY